MTTEELTAKNQEGMNRLAQMGFPVPTIIVLKERLDFITDFFLDAFGNGRRFIEGDRSLLEMEMAHAWEEHIGAFIDDALEGLAKATLLQGVQS